MTRYDAFDAALRNVQALPLTFERIPQPVRLNDASWPPCRTCSQGPNGCRCAEYRP